jgi:hypothetical protein
LSIKVLRISVVMAVLAFGTVALAQNGAALGNFSASDFTGWVGSSNANVASFCNGPTCNYGVYFAPVGETEQQAVATAQADQSTQSLFLADPQGGAASSYFSATFGGAAVSQDNFSSAFGWQEYKINTEASNDETGLVLTMRSNPGFWLMNNVSTAQFNGDAPEPGTIVLFATGVLSMAGVARRKLLR